MVKKKNNSPQNTINRATQTDFKSDGEVSSFGRVRTMDTTSAEGTAYPSGAPMSSPPDISGGSFYLVFNL